VYGAALRLLPDVGEERRAEMRSCHEAVLESAAAGGGRAVAAAAVRELMDLGVGAWRCRRERQWLGDRMRRERRWGMDEVRQDVRYALRGWLRRPGFVLVAALTLALGIGANTVMFTVADAVLFRPLPHEEPDRLTMVWSTIPGLDWRRAPISYPNYEDLRAASRSWTELAAFTGSGAITVAAPGGVPERIQRVRVAGHLFGLLGNGALAGRTLVASDDAAAAPRVAVVSARYARAHLGGPAAAVGTVVRIGGEPFTVVGVMPDDFSFPTAATDLWLPLAPAVVSAERDLRWLQMIGRLAPGVTLAAAERELSGIMTRLERAYPEANEGLRLWLEPRLAMLVGDVRPLLLVLLGAVGVVLVIACANLANLMLARGAARTREMAVRAALGAGRRRLVRQLLTESALLGMVGGAVALALAYGSSGVLLRLAPIALPRGETIGLDARTLLFTAAIALLSGLVVGVLPALRAARAAPGGALGEGGRGGTAGRARHRVQRTLVVAQVSLALVLLVGAGLLVGSLGRLLSVDPGFRPDGLLAMHVALPEAGYPEPADAGRFFEALLERVEALPGVEHAAAVWALPFTDGWASGGAFPEGAGSDASAQIGMLPVRGDAFAALGTRLIAGRTYGAADVAADAGVVVINETMARLFWPGEEAVGKQFRRGRPEEQRPWQTVIGVVADVKRASLGATPEPEAYFYHTHDEGSWASDMQVVVRAAGDPSALAAPLRRAVHDLDATLATGAIHAVPELITRSTAGARIRTLLATTFAALAALLAVVGIYGVMAFAVSERRREIGVRLALGARAGSVLAAVLREGAILAAIGVGLGLAGAFAATRLLESALFGVSPLDPATYAATAALLAAAVLVACWVPARRAARVDPLVALRED
jgi:putative ABC transport system permease protein